MRPVRLGAVDYLNARPLVYGLRIGVWYATLFVGGSMAIVSLTYLLASASLAQRDRQQPQRAERLYEWAMLDEQWLASMSISGRALT